MSKSKKIAYYGIFSALAILVSYIENMIPVPIPVPGIKLGLANVIVILVLYTMDEKSAFSISFLRIIIAGLLFSGFASVLYSASGAICSFFIMIVLKKVKSFSLIGVSVAGGIFHNVGQILMAMVVVNTPNLVYYLPVLLISGVITGFLTGMIALYCIPYLINGNHSISK